MMQAMRNPKTLKWALYTILPIAIISFVFLGTNLDFSGQGLENPEFATVELTDEERTIRREEVFQAQQALLNDINFMTMITQQRQLDPTTADDVERAISMRDKVQRAIVREGFRELFNRSGMMVSNETVENQLNSQNITQEQFNQLARIYGGSTAAVNMLKNDAEVTFGQNILNVTARASLMESWQTYKQLQENLEAKYVQVPVGTLQQEQEVTEAELVEFFEENQADYVKPEERVYRYVKLPAPPSVPVTRKAAIPEPDLLAYYESVDKQNDPDFEAPVGRQVRHILIKIQNENTTETVLNQLNTVVTDILGAGGEFAEAADSLSEDEENLDFSTGTPQNLGGLLSSKVDENTRSRFENQYGEEWLNVVESLQAGEVSEPFISEGAGYLVKVEEISSGIKTFEEAESILRDRVFAQKQEEETTANEARTQQINENEQLMKNVLANSTSLNGIASELELSVETTSPTRVLTNFISGIGSIRTSRQVITDMEEGALSPVIRTDTTNDLVVMQIEEILPERPNTLEEVRLRVENQIKNQKAADRAKEIAEQIAEAARNAEGGLDTAMAELTEFELYNVQETQEPFGRSDPPQQFQGIPTLVNQTFRANVGDVLVLEKTFFGDTPSEYIVFELTSRNEPELRAFLENLGTIDQNITQQKAQGYEVEFSSDINNILRPSYNEEILIETERENEPRRRRFRDRS